MRATQVHRLGRRPYDEALEIQRRCLEARKAGRIPDTLLLLEHPPTVTMGRRGATASLKHDAAALAERGVALFQSERGGDVTYHAPGQWVGYVIADVRGRGGVKPFVADLEEVMLRTARELGLAPERDPRRPGIWLMDTPRKIGAVGVRISRGISFHGFALNVNVRLRGFDLIVPCGIEGVGTTSLAQELGAPLCMRAIGARLAAHFSGVFGVPPAGERRVSDRGHARGPRLNRR